jgi:hypothetical protein
MKISSDDFRVREGDEANLRDWPTKVKPVCESKKHYKKLGQRYTLQTTA